MESDDYTSKPSFVHIKQHYAIITRDFRNPLVAKKGFPITILDLRTQEIK